MRLQTRRAQEWEHPASITKKMKRQSVFKRLPFKRKRHRHPFLVFQCKVSTGGIAPLRKSGRLGRNRLEANLAAKKGAIRLPKGIYRRFAFVEMYVDSISEDLVTKGDRLTVRCPDSDVHASYDYGEIISTLGRDSSGGRTGDKCVPFLEKCLRQIP